MVDLPRKAAELASSLIAEMDREIGEIDTLAQQYVDVISYKYSTTGIAPMRLQTELTNRRQYGAFLGRLDRGFKQAGTHVEELTRMLLGEIESLKGLVGNRSSVPKEQVYPRFDSLAKLWGSFKEEVPPASHTLGGATLGEEMMLSSRPLLYLLAMLTVPVSIPYLPRRYPNSTPPRSLYLRRGR